MPGRLERILVDTSRAIADIAIAEVGKNPALFNEAWKLCVRDEYPVSMRAVRVVDEYAEINPSIIVPYLDEILAKLPEFKVDGVKRGLLRFFVNSKIKLSPKQTGWLVQNCFDFLSAPDSSIAIRYYSLSILYKISKKEKSIKPELLEAIEDGILKHRFTHNSSLQKIKNQLYKEMGKGNF